MPVVYHSRKPASGVSYQHYPDLIEMAKAVDTLMVIVPGGASTSKIVNADVFKAPRPARRADQCGARFGRRRVRFVAALKSGTILAAGLDVFANEPRCRGRAEDHAKRRLAATYWLGFRGNA